MILTHMAARFLGTLNLFNIPRGPLLSHFGNSLYLLDQVCHFLFYSVDPSSCGSLSCHLRSVLFFGTPPSLDLVFL